MPLACLLAGMICSTWSGGVSGGPINELVVFSTSLADNGNYAALYGSFPPPYAPGRFTNGPVWVETLAQLIGVPVPQPHLLGGTNYAYPAALTGYGPGPLPGLLYIGPQIDTYLSERTPTGNELLIVAGGQNNFDSGVTDPLVPVLHIVDHITDLANAGGENFMVTTAMPLGQRPEYRGTPEEAYYDLLSVQFNALLVAAMVDLETALGIHIWVADSYGVWQTATTDPSTYGLTNVLDPAWDGVTLVPDPDEHFWWDFTHPTTVVHSAIAHAAYDAIPESYLVSVPEPSTLVLAAAGLSVLVTAGMRRRRKA